MTHGNAEAPRGIEERHLFIDGQYRPADSGETFETRNPATGELLAHVAAGDAADIDRAVEAARRALKGPWGRMSPADRGRILQRIANAIEAHADELALLDCQDAGRILKDVRKTDLVRCRSMFEFYAGLTDKIRGHTYPTPSRFFTHSLREPVGVVGAIIPWNAPLISACGKIAPALACGNSVILKPAEEAPLSALRLAALCQEAGLPDGVLNVVPGYGHTAGAALAGHSDVDKIAFTGSTETGRRILELSARNFKSVMLELGGKTPNIIFGDADLDAALAAASFSPFYHAGQICTAGTRLFVERQIASEFVERLVNKVKSMRIGDPADDSTQIGPLISSKQLQRVVDYVSIGQSEGARLLLGGERVDDPTLKGGNFLLPTIFDQVDNTMRIAQEEIFGPVLSVITFDTEDEAVALANDITYGLAAAVWTQDIQRATRLSRQLEAGTIWLNTLHATDIAVPFGGFKESGLGLEYGMEAIETYMRLKTVWSQVE